MIFLIEANEQYIDELEHGEDIAAILLDPLNVEMVMQRKCYD